MNRYISEATKSILKSLPEFLLIIGVSKERALINSETAAAGYGCFAAINFIVYRSDKYFARRKVNRLLPLNSSNALIMHVCNRSYTLDSVMTFSNSLVTPANSNSAKLPAIQSEKTTYLTALCSVVLYYRSRVIW